MPKHSFGTETEIVMSVDRDAGVVDLRVFATQHKRAAEVVGTATLRMADLSEVVRMLTEKLRSRICCSQQNSPPGSQRG